MGYYTYNTSSYSVVMTGDLGSGKHQDLSHGLQQSAIYWETGHRTYLPFWSSFIQKFNPKIIDDQLRNLLNLTKPIQREPFVFYKEGFFRSYYGDPDVSTTFSIDKRTNFTFNPCGTKTPSFMEDDMNKWVENNEFTKLLFDAYKKDLSHITFNLDVYQPTAPKVERKRSILLI